MKQPSNNAADITLDGLLALVEQTVGEITGTITRLQSENAVLTAQVREYEMALKSAVLEAALRADRIEELEQAEAVLRKDADWARWFRSKYGGSTFFLHIEREYLNQQAEATRLSGEPPRICTE